MTPQGSGTFRRSIAVVIGATVTLAGCAAFTGAEPGIPDDPTQLDQAHEEPLQVVTTFSLLADFVNAIGGESVEVYSMVPMGTDPHEYQPLPADIQAATDADLIVWNGLDMETGDGWFANLVDATGKDFDSPAVAEAAAGISPLFLTDDGREEINPHAFLSPEAGMIYSDNVTDALNRVDPDNAESYDANGAAYRAEIEELAQEYSDSFEQIAPSERVLVTSERAFQYLAEDYELTEGYLWQIDTDEQGTPSQITTLVEFVRDHEPAGLLVETNVDARPMETVSHETGVPIVGEVYSDELGDQDSPASTYLEYLAYNLEVMVKAMGGESSP